MIRAQIDMILGIIIVAVIAMLVFTQIIPFATQSMKAGSEPLPGMDAKLKFDALIGAAFTLNTYTFATSMPRDGEGALSWNDVSPTDKAHAQLFFKGSVGQTFLQLLIQTDYLRKHNFECLGGCLSLSECTDLGESIYGTNPTITDKDAIEKELGRSENTGVCLRVADYLVRRNQFLSKQAEMTSGSLSNAWSEYPP